MIRGLGDFTIGVAAFPDIHPSSPGLDHDIEVLVRKADAGASFAVTQMVFDADTYLRLRDAVAARRDLPVTPGLMPVTNLGRSSGCRSSWGRPCPRPWCRGSRRSVRMRPRCAQWVEIATELAQRMLGEGAPGLHFITMNRSTATPEVHRNLGLASDMSLV